MQATRFMRLPLIVTGFQVTERNMDVVSRWCEGRIIESARGRFIRVPVNHAKKAWQTEAFPGLWVVKSWQYGRYSFKVYTQQKLDETFSVIPDSYEFTPDLYNLDEIDDVEDPEEERAPKITELVPSQCSCHHQRPENPNGGVVPNPNNIRSLSLKAPQQGSRHFNRHAI